MEHLSIENFGPIKKVQLELKPAIIFIGPQSTGKSIVAKLVTVLRSFEFVLQQTEFIHELAKYSIANLVTSKTVIQYKSESYLFEFKEMKGNISYSNLEGLKELSDKLSALEKMDSRVAINHSDLKLKQQFDEIESKLENLKIQAGGPDAKTDSIKEVEDLIADVKLLVERNSIALDYRKQIAMQIMKIANYSVYIPGERQIIPVAAGTFLNLQNNKVPLPASIILFGSKFEKAREECKELSIDFLGITFKFINGEDRVFFSKTKSLPLSESSSGFQAAVPLLLVLENTYPLKDSGHTFVVEEPELNLYPKAQSEITRFIVNRCCRANDKFYNELIITTHSPYILSTINNLLLAFKVGSVVKNSLKVSKIIEKESWIDPKRFGAYYFEKGAVRKIFNDETGLIEEDELDTASEIIMDQFNQLTDIMIANGK